ncbi:hypothetical protein cyc_05233 [Cyclospora cayetanensis]|uniref:Uncharacterized protein n=1 Tax=Cyclospora cayetanensis TaxID=88456 RepID=A0A1D3D8T5_9EIME|nr:hypothetical protein cyc_05233 [Cyclospora cayetanensis]
MYSAALLLLGEVWTMAPQGTTLEEASKKANVHNGGGLPELPSLHPISQTIRGEFVLQRPVTLLLRSPEALLEADQLRLQGTAFFRSLLATATQVGSDVPLWAELLEGRTVATVFSVADSVTALLVRGVRTPQTGRRKGVQVLEIDELNKDNVRELFSPLLCTDTSVADAAFLAVGGHPRLLRGLGGLPLAASGDIGFVSKSLQPSMSGSSRDLQQATEDMLKRLSRPDAVQREKEQARLEDFDDEPEEPSGSRTAPEVISTLAKNAFYQGELLRAAATAFTSSPRRNPSPGEAFRGPSSLRADAARSGGPPGAPQATADKVVAAKFLKVHRMQQERLRQMSETLLVEEFRRFEARVLCFLNFPLLRKLRDVSKDEVHFLVTVCETIQEFLRRPYVLCPDLGRLKNTVLLGLLDANLIRVHFSPPRVEVAGVFTKNLLQSFCNCKYDSLSPAEKAKYSLSLLLNQSSIEAALDDLKHTEA